MIKSELALAYLARGFSVIPLWPKSKVAMVEWVQFQARRPDAAQIERWWKNEPEANIGVITGAVSGIIVGDVDPRHGGNVADMQRDAPSPFVVTTPGGGAHFYYRHPGGRVQKGKPRPGIDRQSDGCYVVAAGSYVVTKDYRGEYHPLAEGEFGEAPAWLLGDAEAVHETTPPADAWVSRTLLDGCPPGTRNDTLARLAGYFASRVPEDIAYPILTRWVLSQANTNVTAEEAGRTIGSIYSKERRAHAAPTNTGFVVDEFDPKGDEARPLESMTLSEFGVHFFDEKIEWLIPEWLPCKSIGFIVSPPGRFKTMLTFDVAISVAGGWPFLGRIPVQHPGPVLVLQQEDDYADMARRFSRIFASRAPVLAVPKVDREEIADHMAVPGLPPVHICTTRGFSLSQTNLRRLEDLIRRVQPRLVVIDPLYSITSAEDFMMRAAKDMMPLKRLRDAYDCGFLIAAHTKKGAPMAREGLWGSQFLNAFLETGWQIRDREDGEANQVQIQRHFKSAGIPPLVNLEFMLDDADGYRVNLTDPEEEEPQDSVMAALAKGGERGLTTAEVAEKAGLNLRTTQRRLKKFREAGAIVEWAHPDSQSTWSIPIDKTKELS